MSAVLPGSAGVDARPLPRAAVEAAKKVVPAALGRPDDRFISAAERLALTRAQLRSAMMEIAHPTPRPSMLGEGMGDWFHQLLGRARSLPGASIVIESVESWWREHPLHTAAVIAGEASKAFVRPIAQRNPQTLLIGVAALGAVLALARPWRWLIRPALFMGIVPKLMSHALRRMPLDAWIRMAGATLGSRVAARAAAEKPKTSPKTTAKAPAASGS